MNGNISQTQRLDTAIRQPERQSRFLAAFAACGSIERASRSAQVHRQTHYFWMREDLTYPRRFKETEVQAARGYRAGCRSTGERRQISPLVAGTSAFPSTGKRTLSGEQTHREYRNANAALCNL